MESEAAIDAFLSAWRDGTLPPEKWTHAAHIAAATCILFENPGGDTMAIIRDGIHSYNAASGTVSTPTSGYHETLTRFWHDKLSEHLEAAAPSSRLAAVRSVVTAFGAKRDLFKTRYSFDVVASIDARARWIAPDIG